MFHHIPNRFKSLLTMYFLLAGFDTFCNLFKGGGVFLKYIHPLKYMYPENCYSKNLLSLPSLYFMIRP